MERGREGIPSREEVEPGFGGQNVILCSDSLVKLTPQQVKDDRKCRVRGAHGIGSLGLELLGFSPGGTLGET